MNFVKMVNSFGVETKEIPCITGEGAPTTATIGAVGVFYMDTETGDVYKCTAAENEVYIWETLDGNDGVSPQITFKKTDNGYQITVVDATSTKVVSLKNGDDGVGIYSIERTSGNGAAGTTDTYTITFTDGQTSTFTVYNGKNGSNGKDGAAGKDGYTPVKGVDYFDGVDGDDGKDGKDGHSPVITTTPTTDGTWIAVDGEDICFIPNGKDGDDGVGIYSIERTSGNGAAGTTDTYTITFTDGQTSTFTVYNGKNGSNGKDGAAGKDGYTPVKGVDYFDGADGNDGADGYTPVKGVDYYTEEDKAEFSEYIASELAKRGQLAPEYANSVEECTDTTKMYVLPDGFIYAYMLTEKEVNNGPSYTNRLPLSLASGGGEYVGANGEDGYNPGFRISSSGTEKAAEGYACTGFIPVAKGDTIRVKNATQITNINDGSGYSVAYFYDASYAKVNGAVYLKDATYTNGIASFTVPDTANLALFRVTLKGVSANTIITVNEEITEGGGGTTTTTEYAWVSTGLAFVPADYENRIVDLENEVSQNTADIANLKKGITTAESIKTWDAPIYDANIPVFELTTEKAAITEAEKTVAAVYAKYDALMAQHPNYITKTDLGVCSDGVQHVYRYDFRESEPHRGTSGKKEWSETKAKAIIISGIHWEWGGIFGLYNALEEIANNPDLFDLRRNTHFIVLPVCNPYAVANMSVRNANLIEIHRNFEVDFIYPGESGYIELGERSHGGTEPLSEVETQYIDNIMKANTDAAFFLTCHSNQSDTVYGTGFTWASPATYYMCNMHYRIVDKLSKAWIAKYGEDLAAGIADYRTENTPEWDNRLGSAYLSTTNGTETKQATKYGIQATNIEITDAFLTHGTKANPEAALSSFTMSRGAEVYINFFLTAFGVYDHKDKKQYTPTIV